MSLQSSRPSSARRNPANAPIARHGNNAGVADPKSRAVCDTVRMPGGEWTSFAFAVTAAGLLVAYPSEIASLKNVTRTRRKLFRVVGPTGSERNQASISLAVIEATVFPPKLCEKRK